MDTQKEREYHATDLLSDLRAADTDPRPLREVGINPPASALDLPLWRPAVSPTATPAPIPESPAEQTGGRHLASQVGYRVMRHDIVVCFKEWRAGIDASDRDTLAGVRKDLAEFDQHARQVGFNNAYARSLGERLARKELTPDAAAAELRALH